MGLLRAGKLLTLALALLLLLAACASEPDDESADADDSADDESAEESEDDAQDSDAPMVYEGETITLIVPFGTGGGADTAARLLAGILEDTIPGNPNVVVENREGGGGAIGMTAIMQEGSDGNAMVVATPGITMRWATEEDGHDYPLPEFRPVAGVAGTTVTLTPSSVAGSVEELIDRGEPFQTGNPDPDSENSMIEFTAAEFLGIELDQTFGFEGYGETALAMARGEIEGATASSGAFSDFQGIEDDVDGLTLLFQQGIAVGDGEIARMEQFSEVPTALEVYEEMNGEEPEGEMVDIHKAIIALTTSQQNFLLHPDTPDENIEALGIGFEEAFASDEFAAQAEDAYDGAVPETLNADQVAGIIESLGDIPDSVRDFIEGRSEE